MDAKDWLKSAEKKLEKAQCSDREKGSFRGTLATWNHNRLVGDVPQHPPQCRGYHLD
jgi:hypothetical protein